MTKLQYKELALKHAEADMRNATTDYQMVKAMNNVSRLRSTVKIMIMNEETK